MKCSIVDIHTHRPTGKALEPSFAGIHPWQAETRRIEEIVPRFGEVDLVGEIGLDYAGTVGREAQLLSSQLSVMRELAPHALRAVIFHGFIGSSQQAAEAIKKGYYLSFGERTFRSPRTVEALRRTPVENLFAETDESDVPIEEIYRRIAQAKDLDPELLKCAIYRNYREIFER